MARALRNTAAMAIAVVMAGASSISTGAKAGPTPEILVTTTVYNTAGTTALRVQGDGTPQAVYQTTTVGGKTTIISKIFSFNGTVGQDFFLTTYYMSKSSYVASGRTVRIDTADRRSDVPANFPVPDLSSTGGLVPVQIGVKCRLATPNPVSLVGMSLNQAVECPGSLRFWAPSGQWYRFSFQPENFSNSGDGWKVTCTAVGKSGCTKWSITPSAADGTSVNTLLHIDDQGNILQVGPDYGLTYSFLVER